MFVAANLAFVGQLQTFVVLRQLQSRHAVVEQAVTRELWVTMKDGLQHAVAVAYTQKIFHFLLIVRLSYSSSLLI